MIKKFNKIILVALIVVMINGTVNEAQVFSDSDKNVKTNVVIASEDGYTRDGSHSDEVQDEGVGNALFVKKNVDLGYSRQVYFKFDIRNFEKANNGKVFLKFELKKREKDFTEFDIKVVDNEWSESTLTWNNNPKVKAEKAINFNVNNLKNTVVSVDVTDLLLEATNNIISFEIKDKNTKNGSESGCVIYSKNNKEIKMKPRLVSSNVLSLSKIVSDKNGCIRDGKYANKSINVEKFGLVVKKADTISYSRESYIEFDLTNVNKEANSHVINLQIKPNDKGLTGEHFKQVNLYKTKILTNDKLTWNTALQKLSDKPIGFFTASDIKGDMVTVDVTNAVQDAISNSETKLTINLQASEVASNNLIIFYPKDANGKSAPALVSKRLRILKPGILQYDAIINDLNFELPNKIKVNLFDGKTEQQDVKWEIFNKNLLTKNGNFIVKGKLVNYDIDVMAEVTVGLPDDYKGITYYVANEGSDNNDGKSKDNPFKTLDKVNSLILLPGDKVLFKSGDVWNGQLKPKGSGIAEKMILISKYGGKKRPIINGGGTAGEKAETLQATVMIVNQEYIQVDNLEVTNIDLNGSGTHIKNQRQGILVFANDQYDNKEHIYITNNYVHDIDSALTHVGNSLKGGGGIITIAQLENLHGEAVNKVTNTLPGMHDVKIENNIIKNIYAKEGVRNAPSSNITRTNNMSISNNYIENVFGDGIVIKGIAANGMVANNIVTNVCFANNLDKPNREETRGGNYAGVWAYEASNVVFEHNEVYNIQGGLNDGEAFDTDNYCKNIIFQYNYSHDNYGGALLVMGGQSNSVYRYNISANDGFGRTQEVFFDHAATGNMDSSICQIYNNTIYRNKPLVTPIFTGSVTNFKNNIILVEAQGTLTEFTSARRMKNDSIIENNIFWPENIALNKRPSKKSLLAGNNIFADPMLIKPEDTLGHDDISLTVKQAEKVLLDSVKRLRGLVSIFVPKGTSPVKGAGQVILTNGLTEDIMGNKIGKIPSIGAIEVVESGNTATINTTTASVISVGKMR